MGFFDRFRKTDSAAAQPTITSTPSATPRSAAPTPGPARQVTISRGSAPAVDRGVVLAKGGVSLAKKYDRVGLSLAKRDLNGVRAEAVLLLDHSVSMSQDYFNGNVHTLVERSLAFALQVDADGRIPVIRFDDKARPAVEVTADNVNGIMNQLWGRDNMGSTNLTDALDALLEIAKDTESPIFAIVITDGEPNNRGTVEDRVVKLAQYPVFLKFIAINEVQFLKNLDDMDGRLVDNANAQFIKQPLTISDSEFAEVMVDEWDVWIQRAIDAGILIEA